MDEVDGCGAGDRGGVSALIQIIKDTRAPIICICNDRQDKKLQSLINHCYDLKFHRPQAASIMDRVRLICKKEGLQMDNQMMGRLIETSGSDLR